MKKLLCLVTALCFALPFFADYNRLGIPDSSEIRKGLEERWFTAPLSEVRANPPEIRANNNGDKFQIRLEENETTFNVFVSPRALIKVNVFSDKGMYTEEQELYPGDAAGS